MSNEIFKITFDPIFLIKPTKKRRKKKKPKKNGKKK
tara:strand:+ start:117 stop:224 length:108 start_codon:yes stop_codon:yes gene_type:complete